MSAVGQKLKSSLWPITMDTDNPVNQSKLEANAAGAKRGKTYESESRLVWVSLVNVLDIAPVSTPNLHNVYDPQMERFPHDSYTRSLRKRIHE